MVKLIQAKQAFWSGSLVLFAISVLAWVLSLDFAQHNSIASSLAMDGQVSQMQLQGGRVPAFDLQDLTVPRGEIRSGGPAKDGIPSLSNPTMLEASAASYLTDLDRVVGVRIGQQSRAYPLKILTQHEIVNDRIDETLFAVTYCPLCDSAAVFDRRTPLGEREFGVSGLLYNSNVLMYDRAGRPESLWSQVKSEGVSGPAAGQPLKVLPMELTTWSSWKRRFPQTKVLSDRTGHRRNYQRNPYANYFASDQLMFPAKPTSNRLAAKTPVLGVWAKDAGARAYSIGDRALTDRVIRDSIGDAAIVIQVDSQDKTLRVVEADPSLQWMYSFWFAWYAFHSDTEVRVVSGND